MTYQQRSARAFLPFFILVFALPVMLSAGCNAAALPASAHTSVVIVSNSLPFARNNEVVHIARKSFGYTAETEMPVVKTKKVTLISQLVDDDHDGRWDELLIAVNLPPRSADTLMISWVTGKTLPFPLTANVRFSLKTKNGVPAAEIEHEARTRGFAQNIADPYYQMEGPGIENDKVAFRAFFDYRNGKDVYGKVVDTPVLKQVGVMGSWHTMQPWGMDIWKVGRSVGAGALVVKEKGRLYHLGDADTSVFTTLYRGPLAAAFQLKFTGWDVGTLRKNGSETVSVTKGDFFYKDQIFAPVAVGQQLVSGMGNFGPYPVAYTRLNALYSVISTYGGQAEGTGSRLGAAILFPTSVYAGHQTTSAADSVPNTSYVMLKPVHSGRQTIFFFACWEKTDARFSTAAGFNAYLKEAADRLAFPVKVKFLKPGTKKK